MELGGEDPSIDMDENHEEDQLTIFKTVYLVVALLVTMGLKNTTHYGLLYAFSYLLLTQPLFVTASFTRLPLDSISQNLKVLRR